MTRWNSPAGLRERLLWSAQRALRGQTPASLSAYFFEVDLARHLIRLRGHFDGVPNEDDIEDLLCVETEIFSDFVDDIRFETEIEVIAPGEKPNFLADGVAYQRPASSGT